MNKDINSLQEKSIELLKQLIATQSFSKEEEWTRDILLSFFRREGIDFQVLKNNVWIKNRYFDSSKPTILLNSHHDTVKPNKGYTRDPFEPTVEGDILYGLGSNDAGGCLVSLIATFLYFYDKKDLSHNLILAASAEEEISGKNGLELLYPHLGDISFAIVGEPTLMDAAIAEKGLMVVDCVVEGKAGHAARDEGINALYLAMEDIHWIKNHQFEKVSPYLGPVKMTVTIINAGKQHNVVPKECTYTIDIRLTENYSHAEVIAFLKENLHAKHITPRSCRLKPSFIPKEHAIVQAAIKHGAKTYGSPTSSDQALIPVHSMKIGPGDSARSHMADEYIYLSEIKEGIVKYIQILSELL